MGTEISFESFESFENLWKELNNLKIDENTENDTDVCTNSKCSSRDFELDDNETICKTCGMVQSKTVDQGAEWRYYGNDDNKSVNPVRCGMPMNDFLPKSSLGSVIGNEHTSKHYYEFSRIRKYHMWNSMPYKERSLFNILNNMNISAGNNGLSQTIIDDAKIYYKKLSEIKISRGDNRNGLIASSIYMSCKNNKVPRSAKEIAKMFNLNITTMTKGCKKFYEIMNMSMESTTANDFIKRFCSKLNKTDITDVCMYVVNKADELSIICENAPPSIAAGVIYLCSTLCNQYLSKKDISKACEISEVTINKCYKKLYEYRVYLFPDYVKDKYNIV